MSSLKKRRCYWYETDGRPYINDFGGLGCPSGNKCYFAHPTDPQWATASPSHYTPHGRRPAGPLGRPPSPAALPPPAPPGPTPESPRSFPSEQERAGDASASAQNHHQGSNRDRDRGDMTSRYGRARDHSPGATSVASSDPRVRRKPSFSATPVSDRGREEDRDRDRELERAWYRDEDRRKDDDKRRADDKRYEDWGRDEDHRRKRDSPDDRSRDRDRERGQNRHSRSSSRSRRVKQDLSTEEGRDIWIDRIKLLSDSVLARTECLQLHADVHNYKRLVDSAFYENMPKEDKDALQALITTTARKHKEKLKQMDHLAMRLIPTDYFPFAQAPSRSDDAAFYELHSVLTTLRTDVEALHAAVEKLQSTPVPVIPPSQPEIGEISAEPSEPSRKRRRLSVDGGSPVGPTAQTSAPTTADFSALQDRLASMDGRIVELQNDMVQYDQTVATEVDNQLDYHFSDLGLGKGKGIATHRELTARVEKLATGVDAAGEQASAVTAALKKLKLHEQTQDEQNARLQEENDKYRRLITEMEERKAITDEQLAQQEQRIAALSLAVRAYISQPQCPPPPPPLSANAIIATIRPRLYEAVREDVQPLLNDLHTRIEKTLREQFDEVNGALVTQISPTVRSVEIISAWVDRMRPNGGSNPPLGSVDHGKNT